MDKKMNIAGLIVEASAFTVSYGIGDCEAFLNLDANSSEEAFAEFKFERIDDGRFKVTTLETFNEDKLKEVDSLTEFHQDSFVDEDDLVQWIWWVMRHFDFIGYGELKK